MDSNAAHIMRLIHEGKISPAMESLANEILMNPVGSGLNITNLIRGQGGTMDETMLMGKVDQPEWVVQAQLNAAVGNGLLRRTVTYTVADIARRNSD